MQVVTLRRLGKRLGCEKIILRQGKMNMQFVGNQESAYYQSNAFAAVINYVGTNPRRCEFRQVARRRLLSVNKISTVGDAVVILRKILESM